MTIAELQKKADYIRDEVIRVACKNKCGHIAPSLSIVDILVVLYYHIMFPFKHVPTFKMSRYLSWNDRDRVVISKGHGGYALYAILADLGIIPREAWENFGIDGVLKGCIEYRPDWGLEAGTGSLGHGLPMAVGMAYAAKIQKKTWHTYCIVGDGELQEGSCWEAIQFMYERDLKNITVIVDLNGFMALEKTGNIVMDRWKFYYDMVRGHSMVDLEYVLKTKPQLVVARTVKGKGLKCMEGKAHFHYRLPTDDDLCEGRTYG